MYTHQCSKCEAFYIPYEKDIVCPNCGLNESEIYDIVTAICNSANYQRNRYGLYIPPAWRIGSFGDHLALLIFKVLDAFNAQKEKKFEEFSLNFFDNVTWGEQLYLKNYVYELSTKVYRELQTQVDSNGEDGIKEIVILRFITLKKKLLSYFIRT